MWDPIAGLGYSACLGKGIIEEQVKLRRVRVSYCNEGCKCLRVIHLVWLEKDDSTGREWRGWFDGAPFGQSRPSSCSVGSMIHPGMYEQAEPQNVLDVRGVMSGLASSSARASWEWQIPLPSIDLVDILKAIRRMNTLKQSDIYIDNGRK